MRVKLLLALAIASIVMICSAGVAFATDISDCGCDVASVGGVTSAADLGAITGVPSAEQLTAAANNEIAAFGFPDLGAVDSVDAALVVPLDTVDALSLSDPICGVCGECPPCACVEKTTVIPGPKVNLGCPTLAVCPTPVNLVSPVVRPVFPEINVQPQAVVFVPEVTTTLNCFDIACQPCTDINACPPCPTEKPRPTATPRAR